MLREAIFHQAGNAYAYPVSQDVLLVQLRAAKDDLQRIDLIYGDRYEGEDVADRVIMDKYASDGLFDYFRTELQVCTRRFRYMFLLDDGKERLWYNEFGFSNARPSGHHSGYFHYPYITEGDFFAVPDWVKDAVVYQIFPDRFCNGNPGNDQLDVKPWGEKPTSELDFYGGDLQGILNKLPYLEELGVNTLYFTPIFEAPTSHKYDTTNYFKVDPHFGDEALLKKLVAEAHKRGMRVILDAVFNHCGFYFAQFQDVVEKGAASPYADWFYVDSYPVQTTPPSYETFANKIWRMPKLRTANPAVKEFLLQVGAYWINEVDIDGWRLDVANEVDHAFWREFRTRMRTIKPDFYIIGEVWQHAGNFLNAGDQWDAVMNYHFREAVIGYFGERTISVDEFDGRLAYNRISYRKQAVQAAWNLLGSHDTIRVLTRFNGKKQALKLALLFMMTYEGVPFIYYGDEIGMEGAYDPDCRRCMLWEGEGRDLDLLDYLKKLIRIRHNSDALRRGEFKTVYKDEATGVYLFIRYTEVECALVAINNGVKEQKLEIELAALGFDPKLPHLELLCGERVEVTSTGVLKLTLGALDGVILTQ